MNESTISLIESIPKICLAGYAFGTVVMIASLRWLVTNPDPSQFLTFALHGGTIVFGTYVYQWMKFKDKKDESQDRDRDYLRELVSKHEVLKNA